MIPDMWGVRDALPLDAHILQVLTNFIAKFVLCKKKIVCRKFIFLQINKQYVHL